MLSINRDNEEKQNTLSSFIVEIDGKPFVTYSGLLNLAHITGLFSISTELVQSPTNENGNTAIVKATAVLISGTYTDFGDASPASVGDEKFVPHIIRYASTRAKARVLRDALNVGYTALEELNPMDSLKENPKVESDQKPATSRQLDALHQLAKILNLPQEEVDSWQSLNKNDASDKIYELNQRLKAQQIEKSRNCSQQSTAQEDLH